MIWMGKQQDDIEVIVGLVKSGCPVTKVIKKPFGVISKKLSSDVLGILKFKVTK